MSLFDKILDNILTFKNYILYKTGHHKILTDFYTKGFIIGEIPTKENKVLEYLEKEGVYHVISLVEDHEYSGTLISTPIKKSEYKNVTLKHYPCKDMTHPTVQEVYEILEYMAGVIRGGQKVYVHCRSGIGRSPLICLLFLVLDSGMTDSQAIEFLKEGRPEINLSKVQRELLKRVFEEYNANSFTLSLSVS